MTLASYKLLLLSFSIFFFFFIKPPYFSLFLLLSISRAPVGEENCVVKFRRCYDGKYDEFPRVFQRFLRKERRTTNLRYNVTGRALYIDIILPFHISTLRLASYIKISYDFTTFEKIIKIFLSRRTRRTHIIYISRK